EAWGLGVFLEAEDAVGNELLRGSARRRLVGDHVADLEIGYRHFLVEDDRALVVGAGHRAADDYVALETERRGNEQDRRKNDTEHRRKCPEPAQGTLRPPLRLSHAAPPMRGRRKGRGRLTRPRPPARG